MPTKPFASPRLPSNLIDDSLVWMVTEQLRIGGPESTNLFMEELVKVSDLVTLVTNQCIREIHLGLVGNLFHPHERLIGIRRKKTL